MALSRALGFAPKPRGHSEDAIVYAGNGCGGEERVIPTVLQAFRQAQEEYEEEAGSPKLRMARPQSVDLLQRLEEVRDNEKVAPKRKFLKFLRAAVSKQKSRFAEDGFDLDLTYITPRIIAMGFPAEGLEALYRNPLQQVQDFFEKRHGGHYLIVNLCVERSYSADTFAGRVVCCPFEDHKCCSMYSLHNLIRELDDWLSDNPSNVVAVHCKAGKGRTGLVISCLLLYRKYVQTAADALEAFSLFRTMDGQGVTIPSQQRWVQLYGYMLLAAPERSCSFKPPRPCVLRHIQLLDVLEYSDKEISVRITHAGGRCWRGVVCYEGPAREKSWELEAHIVGEMQLEFEVAGTKLCRLWLHSDFLSPAMDFQAEELDDFVKNMGASGGVVALRLYFDVGS